MYNELTSSVSLGCITRANTELHGVCCTERGEVLPARSSSHGGQNHSPIINLTLVSPCHVSG